MASRKDMEISGHYVVSINAMPFYICTLNYKKLKGWTEPYFIVFLKLNDHMTRWFNFGLRQIHPNSRKFVCLFFYKTKSV